MRAAVPGPERCVSTWFSLVASGVDWAGQVASNDAQRKTAAAAQAPFFTCIYMRKNHGTTKENWSSTERSAFHRKTPCQSFICRFYDKSCIYSSIHKNCRETLGYSASLFATTSLTCGSAGTCIRTLPP